MKNDKDKRAKKRKAEATPRLAGTRSVRTGRIISATRAARSFSELLDRVCYRCESFVIERGGGLVCEMARVRPPRFTGSDFLIVRSEEHTSELQSQSNLVCRLLLEKKELTSGMAEDS